MANSDLTTDLQNNLEDSRVDSDNAEKINASETKGFLSQEQNSTIHTPISPDSLDASINTTETIENEKKREDMSVDSGISSNDSLDQNSKEFSEEDEWLDIMGSGTFKKKILTKGLGDETHPERGDKVTLHVQYFLDGVLIEQNEKQFIVGDMDVIQGLDLAVCLMTEKEIARVKIPSKLAFGKLGRSPDIPPDSDIECEVNLLKVEPIDLDTLTVSQCLELGSEKRIRGNFFYERAEYIEAIFCYERAVEYLNGIKDSSGSAPEESQRIVDMKVKVYNNIAASHLKLSAYQAALKSVESVLNVQPKNVKALFRKAKILSAQGCLDEAITCLKCASSLEPETKIFQTELVKLKNKKAKEDQSQKAMYRRMFPSSEPKKSPSSFSKVLKYSAILVGLTAVFAGTSTIAYRQLYS